MTSNNLLERRYRLLGEKAPLFYDEPVHIVRGEGVWLYDADGKRYLDMYNNVPNVGHCHPKVVQALTEQASTLNVHTRYLHETILEYGERLTATLDDSLSMLFMTCSGSEANEIALRIARTQTGREGIICTNATYHGNTTAVDALATLFYGGKPNGPNVRAVDFPDAYRPILGLSGAALGAAYAAQVEQAIEEFVAEGVGFAGLLFCPIFANEGLPDVPPGYMEQVARMVRDAGGVLIFDEVQSGFGRTGKLWGHEQAGVVPDVMTLGKPMGNGHPVAGAVCRPDLGNGFRNDVMYFNTFGGNPVSCAVASAVLDVMEEEHLVENARRVGDYLKTRLRALGDRFGVIGDVRGSGLFFGVELVKNRHTKEPAADAARWIVNAMKESGVLMSKIGVHDNILKMRPPICFGQEHADLCMDHLEQAFGELEQAGV